MEEIIRELSERFCKRKRFIRLLLKICEDNNIYDTKKYITNFYEVCQKGVSKNKKRT